MRTITYKKTIAYIMIVTILCAFFGNYIPAGKAIASNDYLDTFKVIANEDAGISSVDGAHIVVDNNDGYSILVTADSINEHIVCYYAYLDSSYDVETDILNQYGSMQIAKTSLEDFLGAKGYSSCAFNTNIASKSDLETGGKYLSILICDVDAEGNIIETKHICEYYRGVSISTIKNTVKITYEDPILREMFNEDGITDYIKEYQGSRVNSVYGIVLDPLVLPTGANSSFVNEEGKSPSYIWYQLDSLGEKTNIQHFENAIQALSYINGKSGVFYFSYEAYYNISIIGTSYSIEKKAVSDPKKIILDNESPSIEVSTKGNALLEGGTYTRWLSLDIKAHELSESDETASGIYKVVATLNKVVDGSHYVCESKTSYAEGIKDKLELNLDAINDEDYELVVNAYDNAGNSYSKTWNFSVQKIAPVLDLKAYSNGNILTSPYTNGNVRVVCKADSGNLYVENLEVLINKDDQPYEVGVVDWLSGAADEYSTELNLNQEGVYNINFSGTGINGLQTICDSKQVVIDKTKPIVNIDASTISKTNLTTENTVNEDVKLNFSYVDLNYKSAAVHIKRNSQEYTNIDNFLADEYDNTKRCSTYTLTEEGQYEVVIEGVDKANNIAIEKQFIVTIDKTAPTISNVYYSDSKGNVLPNNYNCIFSNDNFNICFSVNDNLSGVNWDRVKYCVYTFEDGQYIKQPGEYKALHNGNLGIISVPSQYIGEDFNGKLDIWAEDNVGNVGSFVATDHIIRNTFSSQIQINPQEDVSGWVSHDVKFNTNVSDIKSGLKYVEYRVNGVTKYSKTFNTYVNSFDYEVVASDSANNSDGYDIVVVVVNNAGSVSSKSHKVYIDKEAPEIFISGYQDNEYLNINKTITVNTFDRTYNNSIVCIYGTRTLDGITTNLNIQSISPQALDYSEDRVFSEEGLYEIYAVMTDAAGNKTQTPMARFIIDKTSPDVTISGISRDTYNQGKIDLSFGVTDSFSESLILDIDVERDLDGVVSKSKVTGFNPLSKKSSFNQMFYEDGTYKVTFNAKDGAGNIAIPETISFTIDNKAPELSLRGVSNYKVTPSSVILSGVVKESYYETTKLSITGTRMDIDGNKIPINVDESSLTSRVSDVNKIFNEDGIYSVVYKLTDKAGNSTEETIHFTIDSSAPVVKYLGDVDGQYFNTFTLPYDINEMISDLSIIKYKILLNGIEYDGVTPVVEDGKYSLYMEVEDEVGHITSQSVEFIVDHTPPKVVFTGISNGEVTHNSGQLIISLLDNNDNITSISVNGRVYNLTGEVKEFTVPYKSYGKYSIIVNCSDLAGNTGEDTIKFSYENALTTPIIIVALMVFIFISGETMFMLTKRRR